MNWYRIVAILYLLAAAWLLFTAKVAPAQPNLPAWHKPLQPALSMVKLGAAAACLIMAVVSLLAGRKKKTPIINQ